LLIRQRSASAWALALLLLGGGVRCLVGQGANVAAGTTALVVMAVGAACVLLAAVVYLAGLRWPRLTIPVLLAATTGVTSLLVATSSSRADVALGALAYPWVSLYAAHFLSRRAAYANVGLIAGGFGIGIAASGLPNLVGAWVLVTGTVTAVTAVTASLVTALRRQSETDPLTGVANRAGFRRLADQVMASAARRGEPVALVLCDVDGLKQINDANGHAAGDAVLTGIVAEWRAVLRGNDVLARLGGDEFAVLMPDTSYDGAQAFVTRLRAATESSFSAGVATWTPGTSLDVLLADADAAMYACKPRKTHLNAKIPVPRRPAVASTAHAGQ
jgi:diguanylate cyclase (GGDEF)-like protein